MAGDLTTLHPQVVRWAMTVDQSRAYDRAAVERGVPSLLLMENAGRGAAELLIALKPVGSIAVVCGKGNNAGDGFVMARHLQNAGFEVWMELAYPPEFFSPDAAVMWQAAAGLPIRREFFADKDSLRRRLSEAVWIVDAMLGSGLTGGARHPLSQMIEAVNETGKLVLAVDTPSGLDADSGQPTGATIRARMTATFVANKRGFLQPESKAFTGDVHIVSLGAGRMASELDIEAGPPTP